jgi:hypothetical protein
MASPATELQPSASDPTPGQLAVRLDGVQRFGDVAAVVGVDLDMLQGEFFSMLGPSGSGKITSRPVVNVVAMVVVLLSLIPVYLAQRLTREEGVGLATGARAAR